MKKLILIVYSIVHTIVTLHILPVASVGYIAYDLVDCPYWIKFAGLFALAFAIFDFLIYMHIKKKVGITVGYATLIKFIDIVALVLSIWPFLIFNVLFVDSANFKDLGYIIYFVSDIALFIVWVWGIVKKHRA